MTALPLPRVRRWLAAPLLCVLGLTTSACDALTDIRLFDFTGETWLADEPPPVDAGETPVDAGVEDSGVADAGIDAGVVDAGAPDAGLIDAGGDAGIVDSGVVDAGLMCADDVDFLNNPNHCGSCGFACRGAEELADGGWASVDDCVQGACVWAGLYPDSTTRLSEADENYLFASSDDGITFDIHGVDLVASRTLTGNTSPAFVEAASSMSGHAALYVGNNLDEMLVWFWPNALSMPGVVHDIVVPVVFDAPQNGMMAVTANGVWVRSDEGGVVFAELEGASMVVRPVVMDGEFGGLLSDGDGVWGFDVGSKSVLFLTEDEPGDLTSVTAVLVDVTYDPTEVRASTQDANNLYFLTCSSVSDNCLLHQVGKDDGTFIELASLPNPDDVVDIAVTDEGVFVLVETAAGDARRLVRMQKGVTSNQGVVVELPTCADDACPRATQVAVGGGRLFVLGGVGAGSAPKLMYVSPQRR